MADINGLVDQLSALTVLEAADRAKALAGEVGRFGRRGGGRSGRWWWRWRRCPGR